MTDQTPTPEKGAGIPQPAHGSAAPPANSDERKARPWWKKKRYVIPAGALVLFGAAGALGSGNGTSDVPTTAASSSPTSSAPTSTSATPSRTTEPVAASPSETPTPTPEVQSYAGDYDGAFGTFTALSKTGRGDAVVKLPAGVQGAVLVASHKGSRNFAITALDSANQSIDLLVNDIGRYAGTTMIDGDGEEVAKLKIEADGSWTIAVKPIAAAPVWKASNAGKGDGVFLYEQAATDWAFSHSGERNFAVIVKGNGDGLVINEIGSYNGVVPLSDGPAVIVVNADGAWTAKPQ